MNPKPYNHKTQANETLPKPFPKLEALPLPLMSRHGIQDAGVEGSGYIKVGMLDNTNGGYT